MDEDMSNIFQKINSILEDKEQSEHLKDIISNLGSSTNNQSSENTEQTSSSSSNDNSSTNMNFDLNTFLKLKRIMDSMNSNQNDARANLLKSLKPYLKDSKKEKIDQYINFLKIAKAFETLNNAGGETKS